MDFHSDFQRISALANSSSDTESKLKDIIQECRYFIKSYFPSDHKINQQLNKISVEPKGSYFPEMYQKLKEEALSNCKIEILNLLTEARVQYSMLLIDKPFEEIIQHNENQLLEFKSTLIWDINNSKADKKTMGEIIMKSISALSNSDGGVLLIGVRDDKTILGLTDDYRTFKAGSGSRDDFELHLTTLIINNFSKTFAKDNLSIEFPQIGDKEICLIRIKKSEYPSIAKISDKNGLIKEKFFIRVNNSSREIDNLLEFGKYIKQRFPSWN